MVEATTMAEEVDLVEVVAEVAVFMVGFGLTFEDTERLEPACGSCPLLLKWRRRNSLNPFLDLIRYIFLRGRCLKPAIVKEQRCSVDDEMRKHEWTYVSSRPTWP